MNTAIPGRNAAFLDSRNFQTNGPYWRSSWTKAYDGDPSYEARGAIDTYIELAALNLCSRCARNVLRDGINPPNLH